MKIENFYFYKMNENKQQTCQRKCTLLKHSLYYMALKRMEKKKCGTYSVKEILEAVNAILNTDTALQKKKHGKYSIVEILEAVKELNE